ncbi:hypothetical protein [Metamycoplasma canadense]|uniref:hypothetical protein n=1 Tax=Metamycoplasma canadense TaxID=29554 RepID=UPI0005EFCE1A|nr:hypothetical protein [Metamycoplasma canadense]
MKKNILKLIKKEIKENKKLIKIVKKNKWKINLDNEINLLKDPLVDCNEHKKNCQDFLNRLNDLK